MQSLDKEKQREAISEAITIIYEGNAVSEDDRKTFIEVMTEILDDIVYPLTSTQLGVFQNFLDMKKLDILKVVDTRAKAFKEGFLDIFVQEHFQDVTEINQARQANEKPRISKNLDNFSKYGGRRDSSVQNLIKEFLEVTMIERKADRLRSLFVEQLKDAKFSRELPLLQRIITKNPRFVAGMSHAFNLLGAVCAGYSILKEMSDPKSGYNTGNRRDSVSLIATAVGGVGAFKGTYDLMKVLKEKLFQPRRTTATSYTDGVRTPDGELHLTFEEELATEFSVDLNDMKRASRKLVNMMEVSGRLEGTLFTALGIVADGLFFGISVYDLYKDFTADSKDSWKIADDFVFASSSGVGVGLGKR